MRIAIVNDVPMAAEVLQRAVMSRPQHEVAWIAYDGAEAVQKCLRDTPDLILMDLVMPKVSGVQATREIMRQCPCAILVVTSSINDNAQLVFEAMGAGALDAVDTPALGQGNFDWVSAPLLAKVDSMNRMLGFKGILDREETHVIPPLVVIGASAGGPSALATVLSHLPKNFPAPIIIIQHVDEQFAPALVNWLKQQSVLPLRAACEGDAPMPGEVLMAVKDEHLVLLNRRRLGYTIHPKDAFYRPSVDVFFESCARRWAGNLIGVLLTGMGRDGGKGLKALRDAGFHTIAQNKATCAVYGMPKAAVELGAAVEILPLDEIAPALSKRCLGF
jgi:chemotaxis response regulator CheB